MDPQSTTLLTTAQMQQLRFEVALENMIEGLCFFDGAQRLILSNRRYAELYNLSPDTVRPGVTLREIIDMRFAAGSCPRMNEQEYHAWRNRVAIAHERNESIVELMNGRTISIKHQPMPDGGWVATHEDISERCHQQDLERQLQHAHKMDSLGTLAGGIAHDLNNTLVPVMGLAKITMRRLPEGSPERANLATILRAGERARDLVNQILTFSRTDAPTRQPVDLAALLHDSLKMLRSSLPATVQIHEEIQDGAVILADATQLHQVVVNLVVNSAQAIGDNMGTITIALDAAHAREATGDASVAVAAVVHFSVSDTGCGIDAPMQQRIFDPFFTTKPVGEGTGLGLSVVHGIVTQHGGRITVASRVGEGARFDVYLPQLPSDHAACKIDGAALAV
jgi:C4-dicarboxylate-specific signal transduction histidine kinase